MSPEFDIVSPRLSHLDHNAWFKETLYLPCRRARVVAAEALALHGVGHAHGDHLALVPAGVARRLGVGPLLDAASEVPYAIDWKDNELS